MERVKGTNSESFAECSSYHSKGNKDEEARQVIQPLKLFRSWLKGIQRGHPPQSKNSRTKVTWLGTFSPQRIREVVVISFQGIQGRRRLDPITHPVNYFRKCYAGKNIGMLVTSLREWQSWKWWEANGGAGHLLRKSGSDNLGVCVFLETIEFWENFQAYM